MDKPDRFDAKAREIVAKFYVRPANFLLGDISLLRHVIAEALREEAKSADKIKPVECER